MESWVWPVIAVIVVAAVLVGLYMLIHARRSAQLRRRFGREYDRAVSSHGGRRQAELDLERREKRVEALEIRELGREEQERFAGQWRAVQARFVDEPGEAVAEADNLIGNVMRARGYPVSRFEERAADISVSYPRVVDNYRAAHGIAVRHSRGEANTEDLRKAMVHYRALFEEVLGERVRVAGRSEVEL